MSLTAPTPHVFDGSALSVGIVAARYNERLVDAMCAQVQARLIAAGVKPKKITVVRVPGSHELPVAVQMLVTRKKPDAVIALGVLIRGDTIHYELIATAATQGLQRVALDTGTPIINGVIVAETRAQAEARCRGKIKRGAEFAEAALEMSGLKRKFFR